MKEIPTPITKEIILDSYWNSSSESRRAFSWVLVFFDLVCCCPRLVSVLSPMSIRAGVGVGAAARTTPLETTLPPLLLVFAGGAGVT